MSASIYWYPSTGRGLQKLDVGRPLSHIEDWPIRVEETSTAFTGAVSTIRYSAYQRVSVIAELLNDFDTVAKLETLTHHLSSGGVIAVTEDSQYNYMGWAQAAPRFGGTSVRTHGNVARRWEASVNTGSGDYMVVQGPSPTYLREVTPISTRNGDGFTMAPLALDFQREPWVMVRDRRFWPFLRLLPSARSEQLLVPDVRRLTFRLNLPLYEPPDVLGALAASASNAWGEDDDRGGISNPLDDIVRRRDRNTSQQQDPGGVLHRGGGVRYP